MARSRVVLDTNALMLPFQFRINLDAELSRLLGDCEVYVPSSVIRELRGLAETDRFAKSALVLAANYRVHETRRSGDAAVLAVAEELGALVVTNDRALLAALRARGIPRLRMRSRTHLVVES